VTGAIAQTAVDAASAPDTGGAVRLVVVLTALALLPGMLLAMTPFVRFVVVFSLLRQALGLQQSPPNQVLVGLSLMLTLLVMGPTVDEVRATALDPYMSGSIGTAEALDVGLQPMRRHMMASVGRDDLAAALSIARAPAPEGWQDVPTPVLATAYALSELRLAFSIALKVYLPFLVIDLVVSSILLGLGMMMLPPVVVSVPFKLLLFVLMDGWTLLVTGLAAGVAP
jgi:flagellar biosynthetic protein FliP